ncbi:MAG: putative transporter [Paludibacteraceae bacterium]|nr:putative transporter [Paludibacteraceae bacterium]
MNWFVDLLTQGSVAHTILVYCLIIALGMALGKVKVKGISLGATFVLFVGLALGHFNVNIDPDILDFLKNFGLILFIFAVGLQVGPGFFSSFKKGGLKLNGLALLVVALGVGTTIGLYYLLRGRVSMPMMVGIMSGAITCTPGLGAAEEALQQVSSMQGTQPEAISLGYAVAYPMAVVGTILVMMLIRLFFRVDPKKEEALLTGKQNTEDKPDILTFRITNPQIEGMTLAQMKARFGHQAIATRIFDGTRVSIPHSDTVLHCGDIILIVTRDANALNLEQLLGQSIEYEWKDDDRDLVSRRIVVTRNNINGKRIGDLHLRSAFNVNITRINRAGINLLARPDLVLQVGDRVMVVGPIDGIHHAEKMLGNTLRKLNEPPVVTIFVGILAGILLGSIPIYFPHLPMPAKLGIVGGPLIIAILLGRFGYKLHLITYTTISANLMLRELGLCLFLASVGLSAGSGFVENVFSGDGLLWLGLGATITILPALVVAVIARLMKMNFFTVCGLVAGAHTNAPPLAYANSIGETDEPAVAYSTVYPMVTFLRILIAQFMILIFA